MNGKLDARLEAIRRSNYIELSALEKIINQIQHHYECDAFTLLRRIRKIATEAIEQELEECP